MKKIFLVAVVAVAIFAACNSANKQSSKSANADTSASTMTTSSNDSNNSSQTQNTSSVAGIVDGYLQLKNALTNDDGNGAANAGKAITAALQKFDKSSLSGEQKKTYDDLESDLKENAEHIGENADKIVHQREHFDMLSQDMYDLVKTFNAGEKLYKDYCPMYNNGKGAIWISEIKEIKNPYLGKKMPTCGEVKEEIKQ